MLWPVSVVFRLLVSLRRTLYKAGLLSSWRSPVPVVVIGNITVGGAGKTPLVIAFSELLMERGYRVGIVTRGMVVLQMMPLQSPHRTLIPLSSGTNRCCSQVGPDCQ